MTEIDCTIWKNAWRLAQERGWSIKEFADKSGASNKTFYAISSGNRGVGKALIGKMSAALGVSDDTMTPALCDIRHVAGGGIEIAH